jgi:hypothetical protein
MSKHKKNYSAVNALRPSLRRERGAALATSLLVMSALAAVSMTVLAVVTHEARIAGSDMNRTQTYYATAAGIEKMTTDFSDLFTKTSNPTTTQINNVAAAYPSELVSEGFSFTKTDGSPNQKIELDPAGTITNEAVQSGPFSGMIATITPYILTSTARHINTGSQVTLQRTINNYLIPIFQFGMFSNEDLELHPGPAFAFNGRVHANGNLYVSGTTTFLSKVSTANELVVDVLRNGNTHAEAMNVKVNWPAAPITVPLTIGSVVAGPNVSGANPGARGYFPGSPNGTFDSTWNSKSVAAAQTGVANQFGGQVLTRSTGGAPLLLPMQLEGNMTREIIKRLLPSDTTILSGSRYHSKSQIRILIDDEGNSANDAAGIPGGQGVNLSAFNPTPLPNLATSTSVTANGGGRALWRIKDDNTSVATSYNETTSPNNSWNMQQQNGAAVQADTVRGIKAPPPVKAIVSVTRPSGDIRIQVTNHGLSTNNKVWISNVGTGIGWPNGGFTITRIDNNWFSLNSTSAGTFQTAGGTVYSFTAVPKSSNGTAIPPGSGITGRILIQIVDGNGVARDVTTEVLSMGMTEGEPNGIVYLQRPLWAAYTQGSRDASGLTNNALNGDPAYTNCLTDIMNKTRKGADGEIRTGGGYPAQDATYGYLTNLVDDTASGFQPVRSDMPGGIPDDGVCAASTNPVQCQMLSDWGTSDWDKNRNWNAIVPINVYNIREGRINTSLAGGNVYERGITNVIEINMRNLARWVDGVFDNNVLAGTGAVSTNIASPDGYTVYVSDRRGDDVKSMTVGTQTFNATNGMVDNEDIYGPNGTLDPGEDLQLTGALVKDTNELPDPAVLGAVSPGYGTDINKRAITTNDWINLAANNIDHKMFRSAVRIFNGENLQISGAAGKLSTTKGITISSENMVYVWGNYNTTGIDVAPPDGVACLNDNSGVCKYQGLQVPTSIVCDAIFPLSKTFFDSETSMYPDDFSKRAADRSPTVTQETSMRAAIIAGNNLSALSGSPDAGNSASGESRLSGGMHNFPRFLEDWSQRWNFVGSLIPLYRSTQAVGPYNADSSIYAPPIRDWAFDITFTNPARLPPGTPFFQHLEPTGFKQVL